MTPATDGPQRGSMLCRNRMAAKSCRRPWPRLSRISKRRNCTTPLARLAGTLLGMDFPALAYVVPGYVVEGLTVLGGKPKLGKSWWAYDVGIAVATGGRAMGHVPCEQGDVLYLALEDNWRRAELQGTPDD